MQKVKLGAQVSLLLVALSVSGCSYFSRSAEVAEGTSAAAILAEAKDDADRGRYKSAAELYMEIERLFPYSLEAKTGLIEAAKAYHEESMHPESRAAASRYLDFYPASLWK